MKGILLAAVGAVVGFGFGWAESESLWGGVIGSIIGALVLGGRSLVPSAETWRRFRGSAVLAAVALGVLGAAAWAFSALTRHEQAGPLLWRDGWVEMQPVKGLMGIELGAFYADVRERFGSFEPESAPQAAAEDRRYYVERARRLRVLTVKERIAGVSYECGGDDPTSVNRIACGDGPERIRAVFGEASRTLCAHAPAGEADKATSELAPHVRALDIVGTGTRYVLIRGQVSGFIVRAPHNLASDVGKQWREC